MKYTLHENLSDTSGVISNLHGFFHRFNDGGFKTKWTGYWVPPYKFLDYYAMKVNGIWLGPGRLEATEYGDNFVFHYGLDSLDVKEKVLTPDGYPGFRVELEISNTTEDPKAVRAVLEPGIDIRPKHEDLGPENYDMDYGPKRLTVSSNDRKLMLSTEDEFDLEGDSYVKKHEPREPQRCFVPGSLIFRHEIEPGGTETIELDFSTSGGSFGSIESVEQEFINRELGRTFEYSIDSMENLVYDRKGKGIIAGHPWFQSYWARDTFWTLLGMIDAGYFELSEEILENFADRGLSTRINLDVNGDDMPRADTAPLFIIACDKLRRHYRLSEKLEDAMENAMKELELDGKTVDHDSEATWMDTLERTPAVDIQSLWLEAAKIMHDPREIELEEGLEEFCGSEYMKDFLGENAPSTINPAVPLMFGHVDTEKYIEKINGEFSSRYGARTRSMADLGYESYGYHNGSVWGLTTGWAAAANFKHGKSRQGLNLLEKMTQFLDRNHLGALPEVVDAENGDLLGCGEQAWSAGMFVHVVDSYLLGIDVQEDHVEIDPAGNISCERKGKIISGEQLDLEVENGEVEVLNDPDLDIRL